jgi:hypothetical protein
LLGNLLQMSQFSSMALALLAWRRQYGPTYWLGNLPVVAIADYQKMVETVVKDGDAYTDRQTFPFERVFRGHFSFPFPLPSQSNLVYCLLIK